MRRSGIAGAMWAALCALLIGAPVAVGQTATFSNDDGIALPPGLCLIGPAGFQAPALPYGAPINVSLPASARIADVDVTLKGIEAGLLSGLRVLVVAPSGESVLVMHGATSTTAARASLTFDDQAAGVVLGVASSGAYRPTQGGDGCVPAFGLSIPLPPAAPQTAPYAAALSAFNGGDPSGTWQLFIVSTTPGPPAMAGWGVDITTVAPPACNDRGPLSAEHDTSVTVALSCVDEDGDPMTFAIDTPPIHGTLAPIDGATQEVVYTPNAGYAGPDTFTYSATDKDGRSNVARVSLAVAQAPTSPVLPAPPPAPPTRPAPSMSSSPVAPSTPVAPIVTVLAPPKTKVLRRTSSPKHTQTVYRLQFDQVGRYAFIYRNSQTGKRLKLLPGSRIGTRTLRRATSAPVLKNVTAGRRLVVAARVAARALPARAGTAELRIVLKRPDGTLVARSVATDGSLH